MSPAWRFPRLKRMRQKPVASIYMKVVTNNITQEIFSYASTIQYNMVPLEDILL